MNCFLYWEKEGRTYSYFSGVTFAGDAVLDRPTAVDQELAKLVTADSEWDKIVEDSTDNSKLLATVDDNNSVDVANRFIVVGEVNEEVIEAEEPHSLVVQTKLGKIVLEDDQFVEGVKGKCQIWGKTIILDHIYS